MQESTRSLNACRPGVVPEPSLQSFARCRMRALPYATTRFTAAGPLTFFVLPKKVSKERRACEDGPAGFLALLGQAGGRRNSHDRACGAPRASDSRRPKPRLALRCSASSKATKVNGSPLTPALSPSGERVNCRSRRSTNRAMSKTTRRWPLCPLAPLSLCPRLCPLSPFLSPLRPPFDRPSAVELHVLSIDLCLAGAQMSRIGCRRRKTLKRS